MRPGETKKQDIVEVMRFLCQWIMIVKMVTPSTLSIDSVDHSMMTPDYHFLSGLSWENDLYQMTKSDSFELFTHKGLKRHTCAMQ